MEIVGALRAEPVLFAIVAGLFGLMVGSFLNVVIHRLPKILERQDREACAELAAEAAGAAPPPPTTDTYNLLRPGSACPACGAPIKPWHNVPVISWLLLRGRCAACRAPVSVRYPIVELVTGIVFALVAWRFGFGIEAACALLVSGYLIAMTVIDFDTQLLPDVLTLPLMWAGLLAAAWLGRGAGTVPVDLKSAVLGAAFGYLSLWAIYRLHRLVTGREGMGYGDFKLLAALGAWLGWQQLVPIVLLSAGTGAIIGIGLIVARRLGREVPIAFGPFLAIAGWLVMVWSPLLVAPWWSPPH